MLHNIELDILFDVVFLDFWELGDIPYQDGSRNNLTCLDYMAVLGLGASSGLKEMIVYHISL